MTIKGFELIPRRSLMFVGSQESGTNIDRGFPEQEAETDTVNCAVAAERANGTVGSQTSARQASRHRVFGTLWT